MRQQLKPLSGENDDDTSGEPLDEEAALRRANASKLDRIRASLASMDLEDGEEGEVEQRRREKERILKIVERQEREEERRIKKNGGLNNTPKVDILEDRKRERWDCETVLSEFTPLFIRFDSPEPDRIQLLLSLYPGTYSNLSNHPRLLRIRDNKLKAPKPAQIKLDPKTGFPMVDGEIVTGRDTIMEEQEDEDASSEEMEEYSKFLFLSLSCCT